MAQSPPALACGPEDGRRVLLLHGLTGSPSELWPLAFALADAGWRAEVPLLPGHGGSPEELGAVDADDLLTTTRRLAAELRPDAIVGLSMGALLALVAAAERADLSGLVLLAPAVRMKGKSALFDLLGALGVGSSPLGRVFVRKETSIAPSTTHASALGTRADAALTAPPPRPDWPRLARVPLRWSRELRRIRHEARRAAARARGPALVVHGLADDTAGPHSAIEAARWLEGRATVSFIAGAGHQLAAGPWRGEVAVLVGSFLAESSRARTARNRLLGS